MKKICFVTTISATLKAFLLKYAEYLHENTDWDITFICDNDEQFAKELPEYIHYIPVSMKRGISLSAFSSINQLKKIFNEQKFDIVQYSTPNAAFYSSIAAKYAKVPVRLYCQWGIRYMGFEGFKRRIFKLLEKSTCKNSTYIEAESHNIRNFSLDEKLYPAEKSSVIWNGSACGVDLEKFDVTQKAKWRGEIRKKHNISEDTAVFSFAARLTADKGINELLEAFLNLEERNKNTKLLVMGGIDNANSLDDILFEKAKKSDNIIFTGRVPDVEKYYAASDVFVAPSYREGFGLVVIEAQAMGIPAIVSNVPGQIDAIVENVTGISCAVKDAKSLEDAMNKLIIDVELRQTLGKQAESFVKENFEQNQLFEKLTEHRNELIGE